MQNGYRRPPQSGRSGQQAGNRNSRNPSRSGYAQPQGASRGGQYGEYRWPTDNGRPMTEREYQAYRQRQAATAAQRKRQAEMERIMRKQEEKRRRARNREIFLGRLAVFGVVLLVMLLIAGGLFLILFNRTPDAVEEQKITYTYGGAKVRKAAFDTAYAEGIYYFCFQDLAAYLDMAETGSAAERRFLFTADGTLADSRGDGTEEYVTFPDGEALAIVNGQTVPLDGKNRLVGEEVWVSVDFVEDVMENLSLQVKDDTIALAKIVDTEAQTTEEEKENKVILYLDPSFRLKSTEPVEPIPEEDAYLPAGLEDDNGEIDMELANVTFVNDLTAYEQFMLVGFTRIGKPGRISDPGEPHQHVIGGFCAYGSDGCSGDGRGTGYAEAAADRGQGTGGPAAGDEQCQSARHAGQQRIPHIRPAGHAV